MYEYLWDHVKPKYKEKAKLCYMYTDKFIVHMKTEVISEDTAKNFEKRFETSNFELEKPLP